MYSPEAVAEEWQVFRALVFPVVESEELFLRAVVLRVAAELPVFQAGVLLFPHWVLVQESGVQVLVRRLDRWRVTDIWIYYSASIDPALSEKSVHPVVAFEHPCLAAPLVVSHRLFLHCYW